MNQSDILRVFKKNILSFVNELIETFPENYPLILTQIALTEMTADKIMDKFTVKVMPYSDLIKNKDEKILKILNGLFNTPLISLDFIKMWKDGRADKDAIWQYLSAFTKLSKLYSEKKS